MVQEHFNRVRDVFGRAATLVGDARVRFLDEECGGDEDLRRDVNVLLSRDAQTGGLREGVAAATDDALNDGQIQLPEHIGPYEILGILGRGGMGIVYRARQENPERIVALKVLRPALFSERLQKRFEQEKQVLARLQHPGIAQIFEAGTTDSGLSTRPWFAMELVEGEGLSTWAADKSTREKLDLMVLICEAVHHAHQKGVIHRDLKPDNILVLPGGLPKILDFGVARVTDSDLQLTTLVTDMQSLVGTLPYMSPEQAAGSSEDLDIRSDVYALGVLTYELLAGQLPHDLRQKSVAAAVRVITDEDPQPLSSVDRVFRGDLETIVGKALEKEPDVRYSSAAELGADIRRHLRDEPIQARAPSTIYQLKKFARRNRGLVGGLVATFVVLIVAVVGLSFLTVKANRATRLSESRVAMSNGVNEFLQRILGAASPTANVEQRGYETTVLEVLDEASASIDGSFPDHPEVEAAIRYVLGKTYLDIGNHGAEARRELARSVALFKEHGLDQTDLFWAQRFHGYSLVSPADRIEYIRPVLEEVTQELGPRHELRFVLTNDLAAALAWNADLDEAGDLFRSIVDECLEALGEDHEVYLRTISNVATWEANCGDAEKALVLMQENLRIKTNLLGADSPLVLHEMYNVNVVLRRLERFPEAEECLRECWREWERVFGPRSRSTLKCLHELIIVLGELGKFEEGLQLAVELREQVGEPETEDITVWAKSDHAWMLLETGDARLAEPLIREALEDAAGKTLRNRFLLGRILMAAGKVEEGSLVLTELEREAGAQPDENRKLLAKIRSVREGGSGSGAGQGR